MDIISRYTEIVKEYLDAPENFIVASAYHIVSVLLGRFFKCPYIPGGSHGARPNIWFIIASIPGRTRRSTVAHYMNYTFGKSLEKYFQRTLNVSEKASKDLVLDSIIEEGTPEGIMDHINATDFNVYSIMSTEFGSVLLRMGTKDYEMGVSSLFSKIYYGEGGSMLLSQRNKDAGGKRFLKSGIYATMFCGMQEPHLYLTPNMSRQGLLRRILLIYCEPKDIKRWMPPVDDERESIYGELWGLSEVLLERMLKYQKEASKISPYLLDITFQPTAMDVINEYAKKTDKALEHEITNLNIYQQSFWEHLAKLAMLNCISRDGMTVRQGRVVAFVTLDDVRRAQEYMDRATKYSSDIISNLGSLDEPIKTSKDALGRIYQIIASSGDAGISQSQLYRKAHMKSTELTVLLNTLILSEKVIKVQEVSSGGAPPIVYRVKE